MWGRIYNQLRVVIMSASGACSSLMLKTALVVLTNQVEWGQNLQGSIGVGWNLLWSWSSSFVVCVFVWWCGCADTWLKRQTIYNETFTYNSGKAIRKRNKLLYSVTFSALLKRGGHEMIKSFQCLQGQENILSIGKPNIQGLSSGTQKFQSDDMHSRTLYWGDKCHKKWNCLTLLFEKG